MLSTLKILKLKSDLKVNILLIIFNLFSNISPLIEIQANNNLYQNYFFIHFIEYDESQLLT